MRWAVWGRVVAAAVLGSAALVVTAEFALRGRLLATDVHRWEADGLFRYPPAMQVGDDPRLTTNNLGFFGSPYVEGPDETVYRVFLVGASEQTNPELPAAVAAELTRRFVASNDPRRVEVHATGLPRYTSYQNALLVQHVLLTLGPDCIVVYLGLNDNVYNANPRLTGSPPTGLWNPWDFSQSLALAALRYHLVTKRFGVDRAFMSVRSGEVIAPYLERLVAAASREKADVLLVAPALGYPTDDAALASAIAAAEGPMSHFWGNTRSALRGVATHNALLERVARAHGLAAPLRPQSVLPATSEWFTDLCHLTPAGNERLGRFLGEAVSGLAPGD